MMKKNEMKRMVKNYKVDLIKYKRNEIKIESYKKRDFVVDFEGE